MSRINSKLLTEKTFSKDSLSIKKINDISHHNSKVEAYIGFDEKNSRLVFVKKLLPEAVKNKRFFDEFIKESNVLSVLKNVSIAKIFDHGVEKGSPYIVTEFIDGLSCASLVMYQLSTGNSAAVIMKDIASAMHVIHQHGVLHLDLTPFNVIVTNQGGIKIMDFGISHFTRDSSKSGSLKGTLSYIAPEVIENHANVSEQSDIYSAGVMFYELFLGEFSNGVITIEDLPVGVAKIVKKSTHRDPEKRYKSMKELYDDLDLFEKGDALDRVTSKDMKFYNIKNHGQAYSKMLPDNMKESSVIADLYASSVVKYPGGLSTLIHKSGEVLIMCIIESSSGNDVVVNSTAYGALLAFCEHIDDVQNIYENFKHVFDRYVKLNGVNLSICSIDSNYNFTAFVSDNHLCKVNRSNREMISISGNQFSTIELKEGDHLFFMSSSISDTAIRKVRESDIGADMMAKKITGILSNRNMKLLNISCIVALIK